MARREELGHPLGVIPPLSDPEPVTIQPEASTSGRTHDSADFVLEIGSEELPPDDVMTAAQQLRSVRCDGTNRIELLRKCSSRTLGHAGNGHALHVWAGPCKLRACVRPGSMCTEMVYCTEQSTWLATFV